MSQENIDYSSPDDGLGDKLRNAFIKVQNNFTSLFNGKVDKITGKGLSKNDLTDTLKAKIDGIEEGAQVNVRQDFGENDPDSPLYIPNRPPSLYASTGYLDYNDVSTHTTPLVLVSGVDKKLTNDTLGAYTNLGEAPYGVPNIWNQSTNQFDFSYLSIGDTLDLRVDCLLTTTGTNKTYKVLLKLGIGSSSEYTLLVGSGELKAAVTDEHILKQIGFYIGNEDWINFPAELYVLVDTTGSVKVNGWYTRILRKNLNIVNIVGGADKLDKDISLYTNATLPLDDTDNLLVNQSGEWKVVDKSEVSGGGATDEHFVISFGIAKNANYVGAGNWQTPDRNGSTIFNDTSSFGNYYNGTIVTDARVGKVKLPFNCQLVDGSFYLTHAGGTNGAEELRIIGFEVSGASVVGTTTMASATYTQGNSTSNGDLGSFSGSTFNRGSFVTYSNKSTNASVYIAEGVITLVFKKI